MKLSLDKNLTAVLLIAAALLLFRLGDRPFRNPDEGRYAEIAREMVVNGDWRVPTLYGINYLHKPVLFYWLTASSFRVLGPSEFSARLVPAFFGWLGILMACLFARRTAGKGAAFCSAAILTSSVFYWGVSRYLVIDSVFAFFLAAAFYSFYIALCERSRFFTVLFYASAALAFVTKGLAGVVIPGFAALVYLILTRQFRKGAALLFSAPGLVLFLLIAVPWFVFVARTEPEFLKSFFLHEHVARFVSKNFEHQEPWYFYLGLLPVLLLPWILFPGPVKALARSARREPANPVFFLLTAVASTVFFFSLSRSKLATYLLPVVSPAAVLLGGAWSEWAGETKSRNRLFVSLAAVLGCAVAAVPFVMEVANRNYTTKHFAAALKPALKPGDTVFLFGQPGAFYDFAFYLNRPVRLVGREGELEIRPGDPPPKKREEESVTDGAGWRKAIGSPGTYTLMRLSDYEGLEEAARRNLRIFMQDKRKVLLAS